MQREWYWVSVRGSNEYDSTTKCRGLSKLKKNPRRLPLRGKYADDEVSLRQLLLNLGCPISAHSEIVRHQYTETPRFERGAEHTQRRASGRGNEARLECRRSARRAHSCVSHGPRSCSISPLALTGEQQQSEAAFLRVRAKRIVSDPHNGRFSLRPVRAIQARYSTPRLVM